MNGGKWLAFAALLLLAACVRPQDAGRLVERTIDAHFAAGRLAADPDFPGLASLCGDLPPSASAARIIANSRTRPPPTALPPTRVFDNLLFVGHRGISAWALETSDGLILIDALGSAEQAKTYIEGGLRALGHDPAEIKILVISHGHGDHYGGAPYLVDRYGPEVIMGAPDWEQLENPANRIDAPGWFDVPAPDRTVADRVTIRLGDTSIELTVTPSHTPGTLASTFAVYDGEQSHQALLWGGTGFNFGPYPERLRTYASSAEQMRARVLRDGISVLLSNHANRDRAHEKIAKLEQRTAPAAHPFLMSPERVARGFEVFRECALGHAKQLENG